MNSLELTFVNELGNKVNYKIPRTLVEIPVEAIKDLVNYMLAGDFIETSGGGLVECVKVKIVNKQSQIIDLA